MIRKLETNRERVEKPGRKKVGVVLFLISLLLIIISIILSSYMLVTAIGLGFIALVVLIISNTLIEKHMRIKLGGFLFLIAIILIISTMILFQDFAQAHLLSFDLLTQALLTTTIVLGFIALIVLFTFTKLFEEHVRIRISLYLFLISVILLIISTDLLFRQHPFFLGGPGLMPVWFTFIVAVFLGIVSLIILFKSSVDLKVENKNKISIPTHEKSGNGQIKSLRKRILIAAIYGIIGFILGVVVLLGASLLWFRGIWLQERFLWYLGLLIGFVIFVVNAVPAMIWVKNENVREIVPTPGLKSKLLIFFSPLLKGVIIGAIVSFIIKLFISPFGTNITMIVVGMVIGAIVGAIIGVLQLLGLSYS